MAKPFRNGDLRVMEQRRCTYDKCGGCMMCEKSYEQTLREKKKYIEELLSRGNHHQYKTCKRRTFIKIL